MKPCLKFDAVIDGFTRLRAGKRVPSAPIPSVLLAAKENEYGQMFEEGADFKGHFLWFASIPMMIACLDHHHLHEFKDAKLSTRYKELYAIKLIFKDQLTKDGKLLMTAQEWCNKWFRGSNRGFSTTAIEELKNKNLPLEEQAAWRRLYASLRSSISYRTLAEARDDPLLANLLQWTSLQPCIWLDQLVPKDHFLVKNLGEWTRFNAPKNGHQHFPFKLKYLKLEDDEIVYRAENQLTLPDGIAIKPAEIHLISEGEARALYQASIINHWPATKATWGHADITKLYNPLGTDLTTIFNSDLSLKTWHKYAESGAFTSKNAKGDHNAFNYKERKIEFIDHMNALRKQTVEESVFRKKYIEIAEDNASDLRLMRTVRKVWYPKDLYSEEKTIAEIEALQPEMLYVSNSDKSLASDWDILRVYSHSMDFDQMGRFLKFFVIDKVSQKYLGVVSLSSDVISIKSRDAFIGWSLKDRLDQRKLRHIAIGSCIMPTQPFGFAFLGGKLVAALLTTKSVRDVWEKKYGDILVGFTTTSLYGKEKHGKGGTMYDNIPQWKDCGTTDGTMLLTPDTPFLKPWRDHLQIRVKPNETGAKQKVINAVFKELGLKPDDYRHGWKRGVYFAGAYANFKEFLQGKIERKDLTIAPRFENDVQGVVDWWKPKAIKRYRGLLAQGKLKDQILFYHQLKITEDTPISFEEAYSLYRGGIGG